MPALALALAVALGACQAPTLGRSRRNLGRRAARIAATRTRARYLWGGASPARGFDCSGLTSWAWHRAGVAIPRTARAQYTATLHISRRQLRAGDLVFYGRNHHVTHVAMYLGGGKVIQARRSLGVVHIDALDTFWPSARIGYGRVYAAGR